MINWAVTVVWFLFLNFLGHSLGEASDEQFELSNIHVYNIQSITVSGLSSSITCLEVENLKLFNLHQVPTSSFKIQNQMATISMESGAIILVMRDSELMAPPREDFLFLENCLPSLKTIQSLKLELEDLVFFIHPISTLWSIKPLDLLGILVDENLNEKLLTSILKYSKAFWDVSIIAGKVVEKSQSYSRIEWVEFDGNNNNNEHASASGNYPPINSNQNRNNQIGTGLGSTTTTTASSRSARTYHQPIIVNPFNFSPPPPPTPLNFRRRYSNVPSNDDSISMTDISIGSTISTSSSTTDTSNDDEQANGCWFPSVIGKVLRNL